MDIVIITDYRKLLRQHIHQYESLNKEKIKSIFKSAGFNVIEYTYEEIINNDINIENNIIVYTSSQNLEYKKYIDDILYYLSKKNTLIPRYDIFRSHENKGYQEILKKEIGLRSLNFMYFGNKLGMEDNKDRINKYPLVLKKINGAGSSNVYKIISYDQLINLIKKINKPLHYNKIVLKKFIKQNFLKSRYVKEYYEDDIYNGPFVLQEFMDGLSEDWKVLVFGSKYYVLNRKVRENDFRASGSGKLSYVEPPKQVLDYAKYVYEKLDVPFISLDIGYNGCRCNLIEFQGTHFGPYTIINSNYYYTYNNDKWVKIDKKSVLEEEYAMSIVDYINRKNFLT